MTDRHYRILMVLEPSGGGSGRHFVDLCAGLSRRGHHVEAVWSPKRAESRFVEELQAIGLPATHAISMARSPGPSDIRAWLALGRLIAANGPFDILHAHSSKAGALLRPGRRRAGAARVYTPHAFRTMDPTLGPLGRFFYGRIEGWLGRDMSEAIIAVSDDEARHAATLGIAASKVHVVVNGVGALPFASETEIRRRLGIAADAIVIGFVGRFSSQKAPERLLAAFEAIAGHAPDVHLAMIGSGRLDSAVRDQAASSQYASRIHINADMPGALAMRGFDILAMPSRYEAMSYVMLEAEALGLPMVLSDVGGASNVVDHGRNGLIVANTDDPAPLAEALSGLCDPAALARFRLEASSRRHRHGIDTMIEQTLDVYRTALGR